MPIARKNLIACICLVASLLVETTYPAETHAQQLPPQDVVVLVDSSKSIEPYIPAIISILSRFVGGSRIGDSFTCYQFSNKPVLIARKRIEKPEDTAKLRQQLGQLRARGKLTNYSPAIQRAMEEIRTSQRARPAAERLLILITDGRRHPEDTHERKTFVQLLSRHSTLRAGEDYSFYCFYIGDWFEDDLQGYLLKAGAYMANWPRDVEWLNKHMIADVRILDRTAFLGALPDVPTREQFSIAFYPRRPPPGVAMIELETRTKFAEKALDKYFTVAPRRFFCREEPWREKFGLETRGFTRGVYAGTFAFKPSQPGTLLLYPRVVDFSFSVSGGLQVNVPAPLRFGPTELKGEYHETKRINIMPGRAGMPGSTGAVSVSADIGLPEGIELTLSKSMGAEEIMIEVAVSRNGNLGANAIGTYTGKIVLNAQGDWTLNYNEIPISVDVSGIGTSLGTVLLYVLLVAAGIAGVGLLVVISGNARTRVKDYLEKRTRPNGKLVVTYDPTKGTASNINLDRMTERKGINKLAVGLGPEAHIELAHISMIDKLYTFSARTVGAEIQTFVAAEKATDETIINEMSRTGEVMLRHLDKIKLGAFEFRYEIPRPLRQVVLYYLNGEVSQGWLVSWNIDAEGFHFLPRGDRQEESYVRYYELKTVAFVRDFDGELSERLLTLKAPRSGHQVRLFLADQEELTGYVLNWQEPGEKFYFFPDSMGDNVLFFLIEKTTIRNLALLQEDEKGAAKATIDLSVLLAEMKKEVAG